ncbi:MAG: DNA mismatch repair endonuclease MutL [candidate division KSB1 bacterium]|nr:DNA mismatch repair endonuclease MutL [candidate division KSB1 bacterium]MDZ7273814.1 DNA mismatch repair endonuclease MutL [candidate division KSB1 bacterium]MDZ7285970.1 DNA mismatch repair endonuclease MutL [candidate division KSB1 bacterium]MDZ7299002.1 DNA mismatch repair endonuclease MutL [candidate division KSB1 bacterium]MDZ7349853.1 DNA mismatch repair endonuclease MutL [candidate division KSB1 bacterium]
MSNLPDVAAVPVATSKIKLLPPDLTNKIAAGEVVERPASVVKELIENSLDAGATQITVVVKDGGRALIQVVDNGCGMSREDAQMAFQRHATSKIATAADLECIRTLGFRGEALASIASVSQVVLKTMAPGASEATVVELEGGVQTHLSIAAGTPGTSIAVKNLFFNTPGRRKFVKSPTTEYRQILAVINRFCVGHPDIYFTFVHNDEVILDMPPAGSLAERVTTLYGSRMYDALVPLQDRGPVCEISGVLGKQSTVRSSRGEQFLFLNNRYISDRSLQHAVISGYGEMLAHGGFPFFAVFLRVDPSRVDVNVHPTKMEVRFADDRLIYALLRTAVRQTLNNNSVIPVANDFARAVPVLSWAAAPEVPASEGETAAAQQTPATFAPADFRVKHPGRQLGLALPLPPAATAPPVELVPEAQGRLYEGTDVWQVHNRYIFSQIPSGLVVIDQHVAHERILYEQALAAFSKQEPATQRLLFPVVVELSAEDYDLAFEMLPFLAKIGFALKPFGHRTLLLEGVPPGTRYTANLQDSKVILDIIDEYKRGKRDKLEIRENIAASFACHAAIRSGDRLTRASMNALIDQLFATKSPYFCPHGRPVVINIPLAELDKRFGRT